MRFFLLGGMERRTMFLIIDFGGLLISHALFHD